MAQRDNFINEQNQLIVKDMSILHHLPGRLGIFFKFFRLEVL